MQLTDAIHSRISARGFLDKPVPEATVRQILDLARHAPSGSNMQPWQVHAVSGKRLEQVIRESIAFAEKHPIGSHQKEFQTPTENFVQPYKGRRYAVGMGLYDALGIDRKDKVRRNEQLMQNFYFFGAPVGLFFSVHRSLMPGQLGDMGIFMGNVMLAAREFDLHTCAQGFWQDVQPVLHEVLDIPEDYFIFNGMALGYIDPEHAANSLVSGREDVDVFCQFEGFEQ